MSRDRRSCREGESHAMRSDDDGVRAGAWGDGGGRHGGIAGNFELNVYKPVIIYNFLHSVTLVTDACHGYVEYMVKGLKWIGEGGVVCEEFADAGDGAGSEGGYDNAAKIAHTAHVEHSSLREAAVKLGHLTGEEFDALVKPEKMTHP